MELEEPRGSAHLQERAGAPLPLAGARGCGGIGGIGSVCDGLRLLGGGAFGGGGLGTGIASRQLVRRVQVSSRKAHAQSLQLGRAPSVLLHTRRCRCSREPKT